MEQKILLFSCGKLEVLNQVSSRIFEKTPKRLKAVCIPTAANVYAEDQRGWQKEEMAIFEKFGLTLDVFDLLGKTKCEVESKLVDADVIYVTGGNTYYLLQQIQRTGFADVVRERLMQGSVYIGCSAGAVVAGPRIDHIAIMENTPLPNLKDKRGMGLLDFNVIPHVDSASYGSMAKKIINEFKDEAPIVGLRDSQAIYIESKYIEIIE